MHKRTMALAGLALGALAGCGATTISPYAPDAYRGYDQRLSAAGAAQCGALSGAEIAAAVSHTSALRARSGAGPVVANAHLNRIASEQACHMAKTGVMSHAGPRGEGPKQRAQGVGYAPRIIAENIAAGPYDLGRVLGEWDASGAHRANATLQPIRDFGIGSAVGPDGSRYWAAVYAARK